MNHFDQSMTIEDTPFTDLRAQVNTKLQRLLENMISKNSHEGALSIKIHILLNDETIGDIKQGEREAIIPALSYTVASMMKLEDKSKGQQLYSEMELAQDETGQFVLRPIANTTQQSIFDDQYQQIETESGTDVVDTETGEVISDNADLSDLFDN